MKEKVQMHNEKENKSIYNIFNAYIYARERQEDLIG